MASCFRFTGLEDSWDPYNYIRRCIKVVSLFVLFVLVFSVSGYGECYSFEESEDLRGWEYCKGERWVRDFYEGYNESCCSFKSGEMQGSIGITSVCRDITITEPTMISFYWKHNGGWLWFLVDEDIVKLLPSDDWECCEYSVDEGTHRLEWRFLKNNCQEEQFAWIDDVCIIPKIPPLEPEIMPECIANVSHFSICQNTELTDQIFLDNGVRCSEGCEFDFDYSLVDTSIPGEYTYTVICDSNEAVSTVTVVAPCDVNAPDFSIYQGAELSDQMFLDSGVRCSEDCELVLDYSGVNSSEPGIYAYSVKCMNGICPDTIAEGIITVFAKPEFNETTYVDPANYDPDNYIYRSIGDAVQHVKEGGTVKVASGTYDENINIYKPLSLVGDNRSNTVILSDGKIVYINSYNVSLEGFTIRGGYAGIHLLSGSNCTLINNDIAECMYGIFIEESDHIYIKYNTVHNCSDTNIYLDRSRQCDIYDNKIIDSSIYGICLRGANNNMISYNTIRNAHDGIKVMGDSEDNIITIRNNFVGIRFCGIYFEDFGECVNTTFLGGCEDRGSSRLCKIAPAPR